jgi:FkbM family methyltransferase
MNKIGHLIIENILLKFPKLSNSFFKYTIRNRLGKFLIEIKKDVIVNWVYDIGAYKGEWSNFYKKTSLSESNFILFEANSNHIPNLKKNNFQYFIEILSDKVKEVEFYNGNFSGDSYYKENTNNYDKLSPQKRKTNTLDNIVDSNNLPTPDLMKIDTQGSEIDILKGGEKTIKNCKFIYLECPFGAKYNQNNLNILDYINYLNKLGYTPHEICQIHYYHGYLLHLDILFVKNDLYQQLGLNADLFKLFYK